MASLSLKNSLATGDFTYEGKHGPEGRVLYISHSCGLSACIIGDTIHSQCSSSPCCQEVIEVKIKKSNKEEKVKEVSDLSTVLSCRSCKKRF